MWWTRYRSERPKIWLKSWCAMLVTYCPTINQNGRSIWSNGLFRTKIFEQHSSFLFNFIYHHVSTKLIHNDIKIMIRYKQYQWQFNEAMYNVSKVPMVNLHLKCLMKFSTLYNQIIFLKNHFDLSTFLNVNKYIT